MNVPETCPAVDPTPSFLSASTDMSKILIVDDEQNTRLLFKKELTDDGYVVITASNGHEALTRFRSEHPDLVILDVKMPGMDGLDTMARMLSIDRHVPVILTSSYSYYRDNFLSWAASAYIEKSSDLTTVRSTIRDLLPSHRA